MMSKHYPSNHSHTQPTIIKQEQRVFQQSSSGPLPNPHAFKEYDTVLPGAAERILKMTENQSEHRLFIEKYIIKSRERQSWTGLIFAFVISLFIFSISCLLIYSGHDKAGASICIGTLIGLVTVFITGKKVQIQHRSLSEKIGKQETKT